MPKLDGLETLEKKVERLEKKIDDLIDRLFIQPKSLSNTIQTEFTTIKLNVQANHNRIDKIKIRLSLPGLVLATVSTILSIWVLLDKILKAAPTLP